MKCVCKNRHFKYFSHEPWRIKGLTETIRPYVKFSNYSHIKFFCLLLDTFNMHLVMSLYEVTYYNCCFPHANFK